MKTLLERTEACFLSSNIPQLGLVHHVGWVCGFSSLLASLIGCYSYLSSASQPCELQQLHQHQQNHLERVTHQEISCRRERRIKYEDLPPFSILLSKTLSILQKSKKAQQWTESLKTLLGRWRHFNLVSMVHSLYPGNEAEVILKNILWEGKSEMTTAR